MLIGHSLLLKPGEIGYQPRSDEKNFYNKCITWHLKFQNPKEISIKSDASKTSRWKHKTEIIYAHCNCNEPKRMLPCPVHLFKPWINMQNANHKTKFRSKGFLFIHEVGKPFRYEYLKD